VDFKKPKNTLSKKKWRAREKDSSKAEGFDGRCNTHSAARSPPPSRLVSVSRARDEM
jgi:hypothetical protein